MNRSAKRQKLLSQSAPNLNYCVVEVMDKDGAYSLAIPESWIQDNEYFWPISNIQKARANAYIPSDTWKKLVFTRILFKNIRKF